MQLLRRHRLALALCASLGSGCNKPSNEVDPSAEVEPAANEEMSRDGALATLQFLFSLAPWGPAADRALAETGQTIVQTCMSESGFTYLKMPFVDTSVVENGDALAWFPPRPTRETVMEMGYKAFWFQVKIDDSAAAAVVAKNEAEAERVAGFDDRWTECSIDGQELLEQHIERTAISMYSSTVSQFLGSLWPAVEATEDVRLATSQWSSCMGDAGYRFSSLDFAMQEGLDPEVDEQAEVDQALADLDCRISSNVDEVQLTAIARLIHEYTDAHALELNELQTVTAREAKGIIDFAASMQD